MNRQILRYRIYKMPRIFLAITLLILLAANVAVKAQSDSIIDSILTENRYTFKIIDGQIVGDGLDFISHEAATSQFFIVGELHGNVETPAFIKALLSPLKEKGYKNLALEIGPHSNKKLVDFYSGKGVPAVAEFYEKYTDEDNVPIPFFDGLDEAEMLEDAFEKGYQTWGVDQEFVFSAPFFFDDIYDHTLEYKLKSEQAGYTEVYRKASANIKELLWSEDKLRYLKIFADQEINSFLMMSIGYNPTVDEIIKDLQRTWRIYDDNAQKRSFRNNNTRIELIKEYFTKQYRKAQESEEYPKVLVKMGSLHTVYGYTVLGIYDIGNYLHELAIYNGSKSFNIALAGRYYVRDTGERIDRLEFVPEYEQLFKHEESGDENWTILDLRPLKIALINGEFKTDDRSFIDLLLRYDSVLFKTLHKATRKITDVENLK